MPQLSRNFTDILIPETCPSEQFEAGKNALSSRLWRASL